MNKVKLVIPSMEFGEEILRFREELIEAADKDSFAGCGSLRTCTTAEEWLKRLEQMKKKESCPAGSVTSDSYLAVLEDQHRLVGIIDLRHHINHPILGVWGGHMGYTIRPSERGNGYAKEMLHLNLQNCRDKEIRKVLVTCSRENIASEKTILANGGVFDKEVDVEGEIIRRYWITL